MVLNISWHQTLEVIKLRPGGDLAGTHPCWQNIIRTGRRRSQVLGVLSFLKLFLVIYTIFTYFVPWAPLKDHNTGNRQSTEEPRKLTWVEIWLAHLESLPSRF
jgi:hypothetical protein